MDATTPFTVFAHWDADAAVWWATSEDVPGLVAEAATVEALLEDLRTIVPDLLDLNAVPNSGRVEIRLVADRIETFEPAA